MMHSTVFKKLAEINPETGDTQAHQRTEKPTVEFYITKTCQEEYIIPFQSGL